MFFLPPLLLLPVSGKMSAKSHRKSIKDTNFNSKGFFCHVTWMHTRITLSTFSCV